MESNVFARQPQFFLDPRCKLYLLLLANLTLFLHVSTLTEAALTALFLIPFFLSGKSRAGLKWALLYLLLLSAEWLLIPTAKGTAANAVAMFSVGIRMMIPCLIAGAYAFSTTAMGQWVCALRRMHVSESIIIPCVVVVRFFPTIGEDYHQIRDAMALRGIAAGRAALLSHPAQSLEYVLIPLLMNGTNVAQDLSVAALTKGISLPGVHTCMVDIRMRALDWGYMVLCTLPFVLFIGGLL